MPFTVRLLTAECQSDIDFFSSLVIIAPLDVVKKVKSEEKKSGMHYVRYIDFSRKKRAR